MMDSDGAKTSLGRSAIADRLKRFGFSGKEIAVYLALVEEGRAKPGAIATRADVSKAYVYQVCERLEDRGLVTVEDHFSPTLVKVRPPSKAFDRLSRELEELQSAVEHRYDRAIDQERSLELIQSRPTVIKRIKTMIEEADNEVFLSISHEILPELRDALAAAIDRGLLVLLTLQGPLDEVSRHDLSDVATVVRRGPRGLSVLVSADHEIGMISPAMLLEWEHGNHEAVYYTKESVATTVIGSFLGNQWPMSEEIMSRIPADLPRDYDLFRPVVYDAVAHVRAGRPVWLEADATRIDGDGETRRISGRVVDFRQSMLEPTSADFGFENSISIDTGEEVVTLGDEGAFLEDYEVSEITLSHEAG